MWTAKIEAIAPKHDAVLVTVSLQQDDAKPFGRVYVTNGTKAALLPQVRDTIARLEAVGTKSDLALGPLDLSPEPPPDPPVEDTAQAAFLDKMDAHRKATRRAALPKDIRDELDKHPEWEALI